MEPLPQGFYARHPALVALDLLGALVRGPRGSCRVVETEAYLGPCDPASRASRARRGRIASRLRGPVGVALVYGMHRVWLLNIVAHEDGGWGAVLVRSCRAGGGLVEGPGRVSRLLGVGREHDGVPVYLESSPVTVYPGPRPARVGRGHRVGVRVDLSAPLRFYDEGAGGGRARARPEALVDPAEAGCEVPL